MRMSKLGEMLLALRAANGWTIEQAAQKAHVHPTTYNRIELGSSDPRLSTVRTIVQGLGLDPGEVLS